MKEERIIKLRTAGILFACVFMSVFGSYQLLQGEREGTRHDTVVAAMKSIASQKGEVVVSTLGSSVTFGAGADHVAHGWSGLLASYLKKADPDMTVKYFNHGFNGYSTSTLLKEKKLDEILGEKPDIFIFETCILNDHGQSVPLETTKQNMSSIVERVKKELPQTEVIVVSPNPKLQNKANSLGLTMNDYAKQTREYALANGWMYIDVYSDFLNEHTDLSKVMSKDGIHPNNEGHRFWFEKMKEAFEIKN